MKKFKFFLSFEKEENWLNQMAMQRLVSHPWVMGAEWSCGCYVYCLSLCMEFLRLNQKCSIRKVFRASF